MTLRNYTLYALDLCYESHFLTRREVLGYVNAPTRRDAEAVLAGMLLEGIVYYYEIEEGQASSSDRYYAEWELSARGFLRTDDLDAATFEYVYHMSRRRPL